MMVSCQYSFCAAAGQSSDRKSGEWFKKKFGMELQRVVGLHQILVGYVIILAWKHY